MKSFSSFKIIDIGSDQLTPELISFLKDMGATYKDQVCKEDIYNFEPEEEDIPETLTSEINKLSELLRVFNASYFRIVYN